jgi:hypothetical protein
MSSSRLSPLQNPKIPPSPPYCANIAANGAHFSPAPFGSSSRI